MSGLSRYEQETIVNYNEGDKTAGVYTHNRGLRRKLEQWAAERPEECRFKRICRGGEAVDYIIPKSWVHIYPPRQISEEQRAAMAARMKTAKLQQKTPTAQGDSGSQTAGTGKDTPEDAKAAK